MSLSAPLSRLSSARNSPNLLWRSPFLGLQAQNCFIRPALFGKSSNLDCDLRSSPFKNGYGSQWDSAFHESTSQSIAGKNCSAQSTTYNSGRIFQIISFFKMRRLYLAASSTKKALILMGKAISIWVVCSIKFRVYIRWDNRLHSHWTCTILFISHSVTFASFVQPKTHVGRLYALPLRFTPASLLLLAKFFSLLRLLSSQYVVICFIYHGIIAHCHWLAARPTERMDGMEGVGMGGCLIHSYSKSSSGLRGFIYSTRGKWAIQRMEGLYMKSIRLCRYYYHCCAFVTNLSHQPNHNWRPRY